jgi:hypothetical protein
VSTETLPSWATSAQRLAERAWSWLGAVHGEFALDPNIAIDQLDSVRHLKPLSELALAGSIAIREGVAGCHGARVAPALVEFAWHQFRDGELLYELQRERPLDLLPLDSYAVFVRAGHRHAGLENLLAHLGCLRASTAPELVPNRALGVLNGERLIGLPPRWDVAELTGRTLLGTRPEPWAIDLAGFYAITHTVFHLTDLGARPSGLPLQLQDYLHDWLPAWLEVYLEAGHWDVVGELLMVDQCLSRPDCPAEAWARLVGAQHQDGMVLAEAGRDIRTARTLVRNHYHSGVVAAIAGTLGVARRIAPTRQ